MAVGIKKEKRLLFIKKTQLESKLRNQKTTNIQIHFRFVQVHIQKQNKIASNRDKLFSHTKIGQTKISTKTSLRNKAKNYQIKKNYSHFCQKSKILVYECLTLKSKTATLRKPSVPISAHEFFPIGFGIWPTWIKKLDSVIL